MRKTIYFIFLLLGCFTTVLAQENANETTPENPKTTEADSLEITDNIKMIKGDTITANGLTKKGGRYVLPDDAFAKNVDSLWLEQFYGSGMFDTIYKDIETMEFEKVADVELPTDTLKARLERLNSKTPFNIEYNPILESVINNFLKHRQKQLTRLIALSKYYFPLFEQEFDRHDIPLEMKYLSIVESALNPRAKSRVGATGLWQFMYTTGISYDLDVSSYVDERSDPVRSTQAAAEFLEKLHDMFGDWDLALAAYNSGPGNVSKAIRRSGGSKNYWNLRPFLPRETAGYVPAFQATLYIFEYAKEHGLQDLNPKWAYYQSDTVQVKHLITFDHVAEVLDMDVEELEFFNPSYKLNIIPHIKGKNYTLRLPIHKLGPFVANEALIYEHVKEELAQREKPLPELVKRNASIRYRVKRGDYLGRIAKRYGVRVSQIKQWNGLKGDNIREGQRLIIYPRRI
ncbi:LysM peptidoglycan-binding domain-containing protein [Robertkochia marina]|uniref:LysM peptidoglycan-binding domain-containing protein n=1 Tax=Robertkochia marina TaxID=1227945 RepID=A0A4S3M3Q6_9FLAO|nr:lytic transglycosylase domain-containing protein [Robertkochia marina]THD69329.1 LysM peptidoglycan-binding domain-containing protein [Robertkochia marina]TRZ47410.1 LysM peptidoglycan-binding domain-containing protein [Robertkochia marina]